jgi:pilus assembly protein Flp/PilA
MRDLVWKFAKGRAQMTLLRSFIADQSGVTAIEYGLLTALIAVAAVTGLTGVRDALNAIFASTIADLKPL